MKKLLKSSALFFLIALIISTIVVYAAGPISKSINVSYNDIKLVIDGKPVVFGKDSAEKQIEPFAYNGTIYLPVRAVGEALGKNVDWDGLTQTVYIGEKSGEIKYMTEITEPYTRRNFNIIRLDDPDKLDITGKKYKTGYKVTGAWNSQLFFNLDSKYNELSMVVGYSEKGSSSSYEANLHIYLDDKLYETYEVKANALGIDVTVPLSGVNQLRFETDNGRVRIGIGDPILK